MNRDQLMINETSQRMASSLAGLRRLEVQIQQTLMKANGSDPGPEVEQIRRKAATMHTEVAKAAEETERQFRQNLLDFRA